MKIPQPSSVSDRPSPSSTEPSIETLTDERVAWLLESRRRRGVVRCVLAAGESVPVRRLVRTLSESENDPTLETPFHELCQRIYESLTRTHLPKLEACGVVEYERSSGLVVPASQLFVLEPYVGTETEPGLL